MTLSQLIYFEKTADCGNVTRAAQSLYISQPTLSISLKKLEAELGTALLVRAGRTLTLTPAGELVRDYAERITALTRELKDKTAELAEDSRNQLNFAYITPLSRRYVPRLLAAFQKEYREDQARISGSVLNTRQIARELREQTIDLGLCCRIEACPDLVQVPVLEQPLMLVCSGEHELAKRFGGGDDKVSLDMLRSCCFISYAPECQMAGEIEAFFREHDFLPRVGYTMDSEKEILSLVRENMGIALIPLTDDVDQKEICCLELQEKPAPRQIYLTYRKEGNPSPLTEKMIRFIQASL